MHRYGGQNCADAIFHTPRFKRSEAMYTEEAHHWLDFVSFEGVRGVPVRNLSYGQQKRVEIARALARKADLLLLDEPATGINYSTKQQLLAMCRRIRDLGTAIVLIEHAMRLVLELSERIITSNFGEALAIVQQAELRAYSALF